MARPQRSGLDYFALDVTMNDEVKLIEASHGLEGFAILIKLYQRIYQEGYYYKWDEKGQLLFSNRVNVDRNLATSIVNDCIKWGVFDNGMYEKHKILTSRRIQSHYVTAVYKRKNVEVIDDYLLIDVSDRANLRCISISVDRNADTSRVADDKSTQSKVKESKVKESKVNNIDDDDINENNLQDLEAHYQVNLKRNSSSKDLQQMVKAYETYKDIEFIKRTMDKAILKNKDSHGELTIRSFSYFVPVLKEEWKKKQLGGNTDEQNFGRDGGKNEEIDWAKRAGVISL